MKILSRDFTTPEKVLIIALVVVILALGYYQFVDKPVRQAIVEAEAERVDLETELTTANAQLMQMRTMSDELDLIQSMGDAGYMPSYNNSEAELRLLNDILADTLQYTVRFSNATRSGDQVRRSFSLDFTAPSFDAMEKIIGNLSNGEYRCLVGDIRCSAPNGAEGAVTVSASATFFETMVGGVADEGLPGDYAAAN